MALRARLDQDGSVSQSSHSNDEETGVDVSVTSRASGDRTVVDVTGEIDVYTAPVLREELAGPLGDRVTRNVRRLVRREVFRVLASQDD